MKIDEQLIAQLAQEQSQQQNSRLTVRPWVSPAHRRFRVPQWVVAVPAAAVAGFFIGLAVSSHSPAADAQLAARCDTVFVTRRVLVAQAPDTVIRYLERPRRTGKAAPGAASAAAIDGGVASSQPYPADLTGRSIDSDDIDYSMLSSR